MPLDVSMPDYLGARTFEVILSGDTPSPRSGSPFLVEFDYSGATTKGPGLPGAEGPALPLVLQVFAPDGRIVVERVFEDVEPDSADLVAEEGGPHLIRIAERYHNRWFGTLVVDVVGDRAPGSP